MAGRATAVIISSSPREEHARPEHGEERERVASREGAQAGECRRSADAAGSALDRGAATA